MSSAMFDQRRAWSGCAAAARPDADHVAVADRLDLLEVVLLDQVVEALEDLVEELDQLAAASCRRHRREIDDVGEQDAGRVVVRRRWCAGPP